MIQTEIALIYDTEGNFRGYSMLKKVQGRDKLSSTNVWSEADLPELQQQVTRTNEDHIIKGHWPRTDDPDVQALLNDQNFMPYETTLETVVDEENSYYAWDKVGPDGKPLPGAKIDRTASVLAHKQERVPVRPAEVSLRFKRAHEIVARHRAGLPEGEPLRRTDGVYRSVDDTAGSGYSLDSYGRGPNEGGKT